MAEKDLTNMTSEELVEALIADNSLAAEFDKLGLWSKLETVDWVDLLSSQPQFANKCNWTEMRANNYDEYYDEFGDDDFEDWKAECGEDYSEDWKNLLLKQPQLAEYFTNELWDEFSQKQWEELESKHPGVFEDKHMLSTLRKLAED